MVGELKRALNIMDFLLWRNFCRWKLILSSNRRTPDSQFGNAGASPARITKRPSRLIAGYGTFIAGTAVRFRVGLPNFPSWRCGGGLVQRARLPEWRATTKFNANRKVAPFL